ncbi:uncharacterized protein OCT59_024305 [Rhizophagus irregularis]|uniref:uncharacterized protein n=1 Tax=Rhizophagus irregularis TaxID=588596 RepID=UPI001DF06E78|nr:hypothetical protein OCT59_024305 [Rhizophagus irregularis]CAG8566684.1 3126_t:CDS:2 [Rhizophagus irregularis]
MGYLGPMPIDIDVAQLENRKLLICLNSYWSSMNIFHINNLVLSHIQFNIDLALLRSLRKLIWTIEYVYFNTRRGSSTRRREE